MAKARALTASEVDGVAYRRAKTWQIALSQMNNGSAMIFYSLVGLMSYLQNAGYGIAVAVAGLILTGTRMLDGVIDPFLALIIDRFSFSFGKLRFFMLVGWAIRAVAVLMLFVWGSGTGNGPVFFIAFYVLYIIGSSTNDIAGNMMGPVMTNDPRQRPTVQVWATIYSYLVPTVFSILSTVVILPKHGNQFTVAMLRETALWFLGFSLIFQLLACVGVSGADKPSNFQHLSAQGDDADVSFRDMFAFLRRNNPFQRYVIASAAEKIAQVVNSQAVISTMLFGILIGNIQLGTIMSVGAMLPAIVFAIIGARYTGRHGSHRSTVMWSWVCIALLALMIVFCLVVDMRSILGSLPLVIGFFALMLVINGAKMCVTVANGAMRADIVDYELDRSGKYIPAVVTATYNFIDQLVSSFGATIALGSVALIGFSTVMPQPTDAPTPGILYVTLVLMFGLPLLGFLATVIAMNGYRLTKDEMVAVQRRIADRKAVLVNAEAATSVVS